jgi:superfamily I DNA/RNA helicase
MLTNYPERNLIFGPPGTGKTTYLINLLKEVAEAKIPMNEVGYFSFTKAAAVEARNRAKKQFPRIENKHFEYFSTLHSLCFRLCNASKDYLIKPENRHGQRFCHTMGYRINAYLDGTNEDTIRSKDDRMCLAEQKARNLCISMEEFYADYDDREFTLEELILYHESYTRFKKSNGLFDFADLLERVAASDIFIPVLTTLIIDEAQDLSKLQWLVANKLIANAKQTFIAGDDDQAIYNFAGASAKPLVARNRSTEWHSTVLNKSYRIPRLVQQVAFNTLSKIPEDERVVKQWASKEDIGLVKNIRSLSEIDLDTGEWCILGRTHAIIRKFAAELDRAGYHYAMPKYDSIVPNDAKAIRAYEKYRSNRLVKSDELVILDTYITNFDKTRKEIKSDFTKVDQLPTRLYKLIQTHPWYEMFDIGITLDKKQYYREVLRRRDSLDEDSARIRLSTMHAAKGREWDNVIVLYDISAKTMKSLLQNPSDEYRALYVAETRAKKALYRVFPQTNIAYPFDI